MGVPPTATSPAPPSRSSTSTRAASRWSTPISTASSDPRELDELGLADAFDRAAVAIEWLDRFPEAAPAERLEIEIAIAADGARVVAFRATGARAATLIGALSGA